MSLALLVVLLVTVPLFAWAYLRLPAFSAGGFRQFGELWRTRPWGAQIITNFYGLEVVLALWMIEDASARRAWPLALPALLAMPVFGAIPAALYLLVRELWPGGR